MEFCPKCGSILIEKRKNAGCIRCGYSTKERIKIKISEKTDEKDKKEIAVVKGGVDEVLPIVDAHCKECGNNKAYFWTVQTRSGDEAETKFFKCTKCSYTWREYR
jgi:DNA-directed RNA polymerase subunit M